MYSVVKERFGGAMAAEGSFEDQGSWELDLGSLLNGRAKIHCRLERVSVLEGNDLTSFLIGR
jgi:hypothetical protein